VRLTVLLPAATLLTGERLALSQRKMTMLRARPAPMPMKGVEKAATRTQKSVTEYCEAGSTR